MAGAARNMASPASRAPETTETRDVMVASFAAVLPKLRETRTLAERRVKEGQTRAGMVLAGFPFLNALHAPIRPSSFHK